MGYLVFFVNYSVSSREDDSTEFSDIYDCDLVNLSEEEIIDILEGELSKILDMRENFSEYYSSWNRNHNIIATSNIRTIATMIEGKWDVHI